MKGAVQGEAIATAITPEIAKLQKQIKDLVALLLDPESPVNK